MKRIIDKDGMFLRDDTQWNENEVALDIEPNNDLGLYKPKWNGTEWVEGLSKEEITLIENQPTEEPIEARVEKLEIEQEQVIDLLAQALGV